MKLMVLVFVILMWTAPVWAAAPTNFVWDRNTEVDVSHYNVFTCSTSATCVPTTNIGMATQPPVGTNPTFLIPPNSQGRAAVTAVDLVGNESGQSNVFPFDRLAPSAPANARTQ